MEVTLAELMLMYEEITLSRMCSETEYYAQHKEQTREAWFCKRSPNHQYQYLSASVHHAFISFREGFEAAGGVVHGEG